MLPALVSCKDGNARFTATDYSNPDNWLVQTTNPTHEVDVFYLYPTCVPSDCQTLVGQIDERMKHMAMGDYLREAEAFSSFTNMYVPYYRQISEIGIIQCKTADDFTKLCHDTEPRTDVYAALDYYFEHFNNGRPFILASHSQGASMMKNVLSEYMKEHLDYMKRMVVAYVVGFNITQKWLDANNLKFAEGESDTGVIISWHAEAPGGTMYNQVIYGGAMSINPLNWKRDTTPASIKENKGSVIVNTETNERQFVDGIADATLDLDRGVVVVTTTDKCIPSNPIFGDKSFHFDEWCFYFQNIKENCRKRIATYLGHEPR